MKKKFEELYPYLAYWVEDWGEMQTTTGEYRQSRLVLLDEGGECYQDKGSKSLDEALEKAERYLREVESSRFDKETKQALEAEYQKFGLG